MLDTDIADTSRVRLAERRDEEELVVMVEAMHQELGFRNALGQPMVFAPDKVRGMIQRATVDRPNDPGAAPCWVGVIEGEKQLEGSAFLTVQSHWASDDLHLAEMWSWVYPQFRKSANAKTLIAFSKAMALTLQLPLLLGVMSVERQPAKARLIERSTGCRAFGNFYLFNANAVGTV